MCLLVLLLLAQRSQGRINANDNDNDNDSYIHRELQNNNDDYTYNNSNSNSYNNYNYQGGTRLETCEDGIVQVTGIQAVCDSPYTFYYGNGAKRNSRTCNYGDKATITVYFNVMEDLYNTNIYMVMSIYAGYGNEVVASTSPKNLKKYVGYSSSSAGSYSFTYSATIGSASSGSSSSFTPYVQIAFSSEQNGDYNLGGANVPCNFDSQNFGEWTEISTVNTQFSMRDFFVEYGILIGVVLLCVIFVVAFAKRSLDNSKFIKHLRSMRAKQAATADKSSALMPRPEPVSA